MKINKVTSTILKAIENVETTYIANDGTVFEKEKDCVLHDGMPDVPTIPKVQFPLSEYYGRMFYIRTLDEFVSICLYLYYDRYTEMVRNDEFSGEDWYLFEISDGGDGRDNCYVASFKSLNKLIEQTREDIAQFLDMVGKTPTTTTMKA